MNTNRLPDTAQVNHQIHRVRWGDTVHIDFMAWLLDGTLVDSSICSRPLIFTTGKHFVIEGLEQLVIGMAIGESKTEQIPSPAAFGPYRPELSCQVSRKWLVSQAVDPVVGLGLEIRKADGTVASMVITELDDDCVTLDANHRLAGKNLIVQLDLVDIQRPDESD